MHRAVLHVRSLAVWWLCLFGLWELTVGAWNRSDVVFGAACAALAAGLTELAVVETRLSARLPAAWIRKAATVPLMIFVDFGVVTWALLRRRRGTFRTRPFSETERSAAGRGIRAFVSIAATYSPNAYVIDIDCDRQVVLLHDVVPWRQSESPAA